MTARFASADTDADSSRISPVRQSNRTIELGPRRTTAAASPAIARRSPPSRSSPTTLVDLVDAVRSTRTRGRRRRRPNRRRSADQAPGRGSRWGRHRCRACCHAPSPRRARRFDTSTTNGTLPTSAEQCVVRRDRAVRVALADDVVRTRVTVDQRPDRSIGGDLRGRPAIDGERDRFTLGRDHIGFAIVGIDHDETRLADSGQRPAGTQCRQPERCTEAQFDRVDRPCLGGRVVEYEGAGSTLGHRQLLPLGAGIEAGQRPTAIAVDEDARDRSADARTTPSLGRRPRRRRAVHRRGRRR